MKVEFEIQNYITLNILIFFLTKFILRNLDSSALLCIKASLNLTLMRSWNDVTCAIRKRVTMNIKGNRCK